VPYRLGVIGDTQGRYSVADLLANVGRAFADVDEIWHAGDWQHPEVLEGLKQLKPLTVVNGNAPDDPRYPERVVREFDGFRIGMVHRPPSPGEDWLQGIGVCIHGHTHRWRDEVVGAVRFINVSTATGAWFSRDRSAGIMTIDAGQVALDKVDLG
jgi:putative phosphoesterase